MLIGGFNGRPEKLADVCYSWWILSSLYMIERDHWIDKEALVSFILNVLFADFYSSSRDLYSVVSKDVNSSEIYHRGVNVSKLLSGKFGLFLCPEN